MKTAAIIVAAGRGTRAGGDVPKQWQMLSGHPVAWHAMRTFADHPQISHLVLVLHPDDIPGSVWPSDPPAEIVTGGDTRRESVLAGLEAVDGVAEQVLIHDAARPGVTPDLIDRVLQALQTCPAAAPALPVRDALWAGGSGRVTGMQSRDGLFRAQTPQGFHTGAILAAHRAQSGPAADDVEIAHRAGLDVAIVDGDERNLKITDPDDFMRAEQLLGASMDIRTGSGFDVHAFTPGDHVVLCGVRLTHDAALKGHSDADVGMHALTDAIYGALADGDIGQHFPPADPKWKGAQSHIFLTHAVDRVARRGYRISNADVTLICETPKIGPHGSAMQAELARLMGLAPDRVSVKATTSERLGFTGRREGIAAQAVVTLVKP